MSNRKCSLVNQDIFSWQNVPKSFFILSVRFVCDVYTKLTLHNESSVIPQQFDVKNIANLSSDAHLYQLVSVIGKQTFIVRKNHINLYFLIIVDQLNINRHYSWRRRRFGVDMDHVLSVCERKTGYTDSDWVRINFLISSTKCSCKKTLNENKINKTGVLKILASEFLA